MPSASQFIASRKSEWAQLERLVGRAEGVGLRSMTAEELSALARAYRQLMSDVAVAQRDFPEDELTASLNALAARAHMRLYQAPPGSWKRLAGFFALGFPRRCRAAWPYIATAAALLAVPAVAGYFAALLLPEARSALVPASMQEVMARGQTWTNIEPAARPFMTAVLFTHNITVSFLAFAGGLLGAIGSLLALTFNGLLLGAVFGCAQHYGVAPLLLSFVGGHGFLELSSITIAGAGGLMMGYAELRPGLLPRRDALARAGRQAVELVLGALPLFVVAGIVEANLSPSNAPMPAKLLAGIGLWLLLLLWLTLVGRPGKVRS